MKLPLEKTGNHANGHQTTSLLINPDTWKLIIRGTNVFIGERIKRVEALVPLYLIATGAMQVIPNQNQNNELKDTKIDGEAWRNWGNRFVFVGFLLRAFSLSIHVTSVPKTHTLALLWKTKQTYLSRAHFKLKCLTFVKMLSSIIFDPVTAHICFL